MTEEKKPNPCALYGALSNKERKDDWATPQPFVNPYIKEFKLTIDACAEQWNTKLPLFISPEMDSLKTDWLAFARKSGVAPTFWNNPPYRGLYKWMDKAHQESERGALIINLVPPTVEQKWWHELVVPMLKLAEKGLPAPGFVRWVKGRIKFERPPKWEFVLNKESENKEFQILTAEDYTRVDVNKKIGPTKGNIVVGFLPPGMVFHKGKIIHLS